ncbi:MAG: TIGR00730 family Rossman fold protein [Gemmatimonadota bacterium]|nr:TIGR00730 family Rossman fold protein [Gemmatimonadota bacterium]MDH5804000.1 TIGR00730 family Rossman fold protein [Gemmatimonadota bacterium]
MNSDLKKSVCVFCGSNPGKSPVFLEAAHEVGSSLAKRGIRVVYGAGGTGMMGALADGALDAGGEVVGIMPEFLVEQERARDELTELRTVSSLDQRKGMMMKLADGFLSLPGGFGTFDELFEVVTWRQLEVHLKPCAILNVEGYFDPLIAMLDRAVAEELLRPQHRALLMIENDWNVLLDRLVGAIA